MAYLLEMKNIVKSFARVKAVNNVSLSVNAGEVLSLCGENGSGKSTLMKVLCGIYPYGSYQGEIHFAGELLKASHIRDTEKKGIAIIHQELAIIKQLSVLENIFLGMEITRYGVLDYPAMTLRCRKLLQQVKLSVSPDTLAGELGTGQQQLLEIAKALNKQVRLLILDEPSAALTEKETAVLLEIIKELQQHHIACIYISHKLNEVKAISSRICVIRDGQHIATVDTRNIREEEIITMMVGRELTTLYPAFVRQPGREILRVENLTAWHPVHHQIKRVNNLSFSLRQGEILGIAGLVGAGRTEAAQCLFGFYPGPWQGNIFINGKPVTIKNCQQAIQYGIVMAPEDRKKQGIIPVMSLGKNITLASLKRFSGAFSILNDAMEYNSVLQSILDLKIKASSAHQPVNRLSGGNQQKAILARCLLLNPKILILDEPTRGIDIGAKYEIYKLINQLVRQGISVIVISSELPEVLGLSDRILVMHEGNLKGNLINDNLTQQQVMQAALRSEDHAKK